jgi:hypothetical protein
LFASESECAAPGSTSFERFGSVLTDEPRVDLFAIQISQVEVIFKIFIYPSVLSSSFF